MHKTLCIFKTIRLESELLNEKDVFILCMFCQRVEDKTGLNKSQLVCSVKLAYLISFLSLHLKHITSDLNTFIFHQMLD